MTLVRSLSVAAALILLSGCTSLPFRFPWQGAGDPQHPSISGHTNPNDDGSARGKGQSPKQGLTLPPVMTLADAGLPPASAQEIASCAKTLALTAEMLRYVIRADRWAAPPTWLAMDAELVHHALIGPLRSPGFFLMARDVR